MIGVTANQSNFKLFNKNSSLLSKCINYSIKSKNSKTLNKSQVDQSLLASAYSNRFDYNKPSFELTNAVHKDANYARNNSTFEPQLVSKQQYGSIKNVQNKVSGLNNIRDQVEGPVRNNYLSTNNCQTNVSKTSGRYTVAGMRDLPKSGNLVSEDAKKLGTKSKNFSKKEAYNTNLSLKLASSCNFSSTNDLYQLKSRPGLQQNTDKMAKLHRS